MNNPIPEPLRGADVISWAQPVTRALNALHDKIGAPTRNERDRRPSRQPLPFEVRWAADENNGDGAWVIWLPAKARMVILGKVGNAEISSGIVAATTLSTGWFRLTNVSSTDSQVWLNVWDATAIGGNRGAGINSGVVGGLANVIRWSQLVATVSYDSSTGAASVKQVLDSVVTFTYDNAGVVMPDNISTEFIPDPPSGTSPDGDEGQLQIKGFKTGTPADTNTITDYLQGVANIPSGGISLVCRTIDTNQARQIIYIPLAALFSSSSIAANVSFTKVGDIQWNPSTHTLQKRVDTVNLKTGAVTQGNWSDITNGNTTPISDII